MSLNKRAVQAERMVESALRAVDRLRAALEPFARQDVEGMISLEECDLEREHFFAARRALSTLSHLPTTEPAKVREAAIRECIAAVKSVPDDDYSLLDEAIAALEALLPATEPAKAEEEPRKIAALPSCECGQTLYDWCPTCNAPLAEEQA